VNRQIHDEGIEVLYGKSTFCFQNPGELLRFEDQIGTRNQTLVHSLEISTAVISENYSVPDPDLVAPCDWQGVPTHWSKALMMSKLGDIVKMTITVEDLGSSDRNLVAVSTVLQQAIEDVLKRNRDGELKRQLTLKGFGHPERDKFPKEWDVRIEQWEEVDDEDFYSCLYD